MEAGHFLYYLALSLYCVHAIALRKGQTLAVIATSAGIAITSAGWLLLLPLQKSFLGFLLVITGTIGLTAVLLLAVATFKQGWQRHIVAFVWFAVFGLFFDVVLQFPWLYAANFFATVPVARNLISLFGVPVASWCFLISVYAFAEHGRARYVVAALAIALTFLSPSPSSAPGTLHTLIANTNFEPQQSKERVQHLLQCVRANPEADLFLFPESVIRKPVSYDFIHSDSRIKRLQLALLPNQTALLGVNLYREDRELNCALLVTPDSIVKIVEKTHYIPAEEMPITSWKQAAAIVFGRAVITAAPTVSIGSTTVGVNICYDSCFPVTTTAETTAIIILTEEHFFQNNYGKHFYFSHAVARALETGKVIIRCSNGGRTGHINARGQFTEAGRVLL